MSNETKKKIGLIPKLILGIIVGIIIGLTKMEFLIGVIITLSSIFNALLKFIIPLMILAFITKGISDLQNGAGKLLGFTTGISYSSTLIAGSAAFLVAITLFPKFISPESFQALSEGGKEVAPFFQIPLSPLLDVTGAVVLAFLLGISISAMRGKEIGETTYNLFSEFSLIITKILNKVIIPLLPFYIMATFANLTYSGQAFSILNVLWKVFLVVIILHLLYLVLLFTIAGIVGKKNPFQMLKTQIPGYLTAIGTQSSAATIPVNLECAEKNGVSKEIRDFVIPLCANIHMAGSMTTITCCVTSILLMQGMEINLSIIIPFILTLGIVMVASPGAPGGAVMSALPFLPMVGIPTEGQLATLLITLYLTQDSFGTACNVSGDNAIAVIVDSFYKKFIKKNS